MILVTGADGFVGRHVVARLTDQFGPENVRSLVSGRGGEERAIHGSPRMVGDLRVRAGLDPAVADVETVVHLASKNIDTDRSGFEATNVEGTRNLLDAAIKAGARHFIYLSSVGVYGHSPHRLVDETAPLHPDTPLARSRVAAESLLLDRHRSQEIGVTLLRPRFIYGEGDRHFIARLLPALVRYPFLINGGRAQLSMVWAGDVAGAIARLIVEPPALTDPDPIYHINDGQPRTYRDLARFLCDTYGLRLPRLSLPTWLLHPLLRLRERLTGTDPETATSSLTSMRLKLVGNDNSFSTARWQRDFPDFEWTQLEEIFPELEEYYRPALPDHARPAGPDHAADPGQPSGTSPS